MVASTRAARIVEDRILSAINSSSGRALRAASLELGLHAVMPYIAVAVRAGLVEAGSSEFEIRVEVNEAEGTIDVTSAAKRPVDSILLHLEV